MAEDTRRLAASEVVEQLRPLGFERVEHHIGSTYKDCSTVIVAPIRGPKVEDDREQPKRLEVIHRKVVNSWLGLIAPMNQKRAFLLIQGDEVGHAYNQMISQILADPNLSTWRYVLTLEDDNVVPPDAHIRLLESIDQGHYDAVSGLYFTKGDINMPMAYGDPEEFAMTGVLDFRPRDVREAVARGNIMPVCGIAMGCALWRMDMFRSVPGPWFVTVADLIPDKGPTAFTQDLYFCERAARSGKRFAVDMRVRVGHVDVETGIVY